MLGLLMAPAGTFGQRLRDEMAVRRMGVGMLSELSHISRTTLYAYINDERIPDTKQCRILAGVFRVPETAVLAWAGHLSDEGAALPPPTVDIIPELQIKLRLFSPEEQRDWVEPLLDVALSLRERPARYTAAPPPPAPPPPDEPPAPEGPAPSR